MRIVGMLALVAVVPLGLCVKADEAKPEGLKELPVALESMPSQTKLTGTIVLRSIRVDGEFGTLEIPVSVLTQIEFAAQTREDGKALHRINTTTSGEEITGVIVAPEKIAITTRYGTATPNWNGVRVLHFVPGAAPEGDEPNVPISIRPADTPGGAPDGQVEVTGALVRDGDPSPKGDGQVEVTGAFVRDHDPLPEKAPVISLPEGSTVLGRLLYRGRPLERVVIDLVASNRTNAGSFNRWEARTDSQGRFRFENVPQEREYDLFFPMATLQNFGAIAPRHVKVGPHSAEVDAGDITVETGHKVGGWVALSGLKTLSEQAIVYVEVGDWDTIGCPVDAQGRFEIRGVPSTSVTVRAVFANQRSAPTGHRLCAEHRSLDPITRTRLRGRVDRDIDGLMILYEPGDEPKRTDVPARVEIIKEIADRPLAGAESWQ